MRELGGDRRPTMWRSDTGTAPVKVGNGGVAAYYSGSPEYAGTVNTVRLTPDGEVVVVRTPLDITREPTGL